MLKQWTAQLWSEMNGDVSRRVNAFRRRVEASAHAGDSAPFVDGVTYLAMYAHEDGGVIVVAMVDYFAEEELMPE